MAISGDNKNLNRLLVTLFNSILDTESKAVITEEFKDITENDMHILEAVGLGETRKMSDVAKNLGITVGTLTVNVNALEKKEYVKRKRSENDKRVVYVVLTEKGRKAYFHHRDFHKKMIKTVINEFTVEEQEILMRCLAKLNDFFVNFESKMI